MNTLMLDAEPPPPDIELREAMDATRGEGDAVVRAQRARQAELPEGPLEDRAGAPALDVWQSLAGEEIAGMLIRDREGVAPHAVAGLQGVSPIIPVYSVTYLPGLYAERPKNSMEPTRPAECAPDRRY